MRAKVEILTQQDILRPDSERQPLFGIDRWVADFDQHLDQVVGNADSTRKNYVRYAWRFLTESFGAEEPDWPRLQADQITKFVRRAAAKLQPSGCRQPVAAIRSLLRFLVARGVVLKGLEGPYHLYAVGAILHCRATFRPLK